MVQEFKKNPSKWFKNSLFQYSNCPKKIKFKPKYDLFQTEFMNENPELASLCKPDEINDFAK